MKRFSEQLKKKAKSLRLKAGESRDLKERLVSYMEYHPLPKDSQVNVTDKTLSPNAQMVRIFNIKSWKSMRWSAVFAVAILMVVPYVAERAVPGDVLYSVKVNLNEEVKGTLTRGSYEKVVWETERLNRRIAEARLLAGEGKMTEEMEESVAEAVRAHSENARKEIKHLKETDEGGAILAYLQLDTAIDIQSAALKKRVKISDKENPTDRIADILAIEAKAIGGETSSSGLPTRERLAAQVEIDTTRAYELLSSIEDIATEEEKKDIQRRLEDIGRKAEAAFGVSASSEMENTNEEDVASRLDMLNVLQDTQKLIVFMTDIDVHSSVTVNDIVPVTLTKEERLASLTQKRQEIHDFLDEVTILLNVADTNTEPEIIEETLLTVDDIRESLTKIDSEFDGGEFTMEDIEAIEKEIDSLYEAMMLVMDIAGLSTEDSAEGESDSKEAQGVESEVDDKATSSEEIVSGDGSPDLINKSSSTNIIASTTHETKIATGTGNIISTIATSGTSSVKEKSAEDDN